MDTEVRSSIESALDGFIEKGDLKYVLKWIRQEPTKSSFRDLALGYMIGGMFSTAVCLISQREVFLGRMHKVTDRDKFEIRAMIRQRLPRIMERVERESYR